MTCFSFYSLDNKESIQLSEFSCTFSINNRMQCHSVSIIYVSPHPWLFKEMVLLDVIAKDGSEVLDYNFF